jgi:hypothetical protein
MQEKVSSENRAVSSEPEEQEPMIEVEAFAAARPKFIRGDADEGSEGN